jgi:hypothetical protein
MQTREPDLRRRGNRDRHRQGASTRDLDRSGNSYHGAGDFFHYDMTGTPVFNGTFTICAVKICVEAPQ